jgi:ATP-dependent 26S proteasome regulatory subunit
MSAMMVIEDVDLIAPEREQMHNPGQEVLLNKLLNEMDGLREDADVIFILTSNRPDHLEPALASQPGRINRAIELRPALLRRVASIAAYHGFSRAAQRKGKSRVHQGIDASNRPIPN